MKHVNNSGGKFKWKFKKGYFQRTGSVSLLAFVQEQERHWRGTLLAALTIGILSGIIILLGLYVTSWDERINYQRFTIPELILIGETTRNPQFHWHGDRFLYESVDKSWSEINLDQSNDIQTFSDALKRTRKLNLQTEDLPNVSGLWPNAKHTAWLVRYAKTKISPQDVGYHYVVIISHGSRRIPINPENNSESSLLVHYAQWGNGEYELFAQTGQHVYHTTDVLLQNGHFHCVTCKLPTDRIYGYPGWIYQQYFDYGHTGAFWQAIDSDHLLLLATNENHLRNLTVVTYGSDGNRQQIHKAVYSAFQDTATRDTFKVPIVDVVLLNLQGTVSLNISWTTLIKLATEATTNYEKQQTERGIYITRIQWYNATSFLLTAVSANQHCGFLFFCPTTNTSCQTIWHLCIKSGFIDMTYPPEQMFGIPDGNGRFLMVLPMNDLELGHSRQIATVQIVPGRPNRVTWLTKPPIKLHQLVHANSTSILFTASRLPTTRHLYRIDRAPGGQFHCVSCNTLNNTMIDLLPKLQLDLRRFIVSKPVDMNPGIQTNFSYRTIGQIHSSASGRCFLTQWSTGYEAFGGAGYREVPTRRLINQLTREAHNTTQYKTDELQENALFNEETGLGLWCLEEKPQGIFEANLLWHSYLLLHPMELMEESKSTRTRRSADTPQQVKSAKQPPEPAYRIKAKARFMNASHHPMHMLYPNSSIGDRPIPMLLELYVSFLPIPDHKTSRTATPTHRSRTVDGALVRIWFPPYLNDRYMQSYPVIVNVVSTYGRTSPALRRLLDQLIVYLSGSLDIVVIQVQQWLGEAEKRVRQDAMNGELVNYHTLLKSLSEKYQNFQNNRSALIGVQGFHAHLAGLLLRSDQKALNLTCAALVSPITDLGLHEFAEVTKISGNRKRLDSSNFELTSKSRYYEGKEVLLVHGTADTTVPFTQTMKLLSKLSTRNVKVSLMPLYDVNEEFDDPTIRIAFLRRMATFLHDCLKRDPHELADLFE